MNGKIMSTYVTYEGTVATGQNQIMYCEHSWDQPYCGPSAPISVSDGGASDSQPDAAYTPGWLLNPSCFCYGFFMSSSHFREDGSDVLRLFHYGTAVRLNIAGTAYTPSTVSGCSVHCPVGGANFTYQGNLYPFTVVEENVASRQTFQRNYRSKNSDFSQYYDDGTIHTRGNLPQAVRTPGYDAPGVKIGAALATNDQGGLYLTIFNTQPNGCP